MILKPFAVHSLDGKTFYEGEAPKDMTADEIKALVERLRKHRETGTCMEGTVHLAEKAADALETLTLENQRLRADAERYRWLRDEANRSYVEFDVYGGAIISAPSAENLDEEVDAARSRIDKEKT